MATVLTDAGRAKLLVATPLAPVVLTSIAFGDGGGSMPTVLPTVTTLVNELLRVPCSNPVRDTTDPTIIAVSGTIPRTFGGGTLREVGLYDNVGVLIAYGSVATQIVPAPTTEYGLSYTGTIRVKLDNTTMTTVINSDAVAFDHRGLTFRDEPDAHPASAISLTQAGRTVQNMNDICKFMDVAAPLIVGEEYVLTTNNTFTLPSTSGLADNSKVLLRKRGSVNPVVQVNNTGTEQIYIGKESTDMASYDSFLYSINSAILLIWNDTDNRWEMQ